MLRQLQQGAAQHHAAIATEALQDQTGQRRWQLAVTHAQQAVAPQPQLIRVLLMVLLQQGQIVLLLGLKQFRCQQETAMAAESGFFDEPTQTSFGQLPAPGQVRHGQGLLPA
nr:hypothetical protein [Shewanella algae]